MMLGLKSVALHDEIRSAPVRRKRGPAIGQRRLAIEAALAEVDEHGAPLTFAAIGERFGVTRERVRQIAAQAGTNGTARIRARTAIVHAEDWRQTFKSTVRRWLRAEGYRQCACGTVYPIIHGHSYCRECNAKNVRVFMASRKATNPQEWRRQIRGYNNTQYLRRYGKPLRVLPLYRINRWLATATVPARYCPKCHLAVDLEQWGACAFCKPCVREIHRARKTAKCT